MQTPPILQQIATPNSPIKNNTELNDNNRLKSNNEGISSFKKILNKEVNNQNKSKIDSPSIKNESAHKNNETKSPNKKIVSKEEQANDNSISFNNQSILTFVENIEGLKDAESPSLINQTQLLSDDGLKDPQTLTLALQITSENPAPLRNKASSNSASLINEVNDVKLTGGIEISLESENIQLENPTKETLTQGKIVSQKDNLMSSDTIDKIVSAPSKLTSSAPLSKKDNLMSSDTIDKIVSDPSKLTSSAPLSKKDNLMSSDTIDKIVSAPSKLTSSAPQSKNENNALQAPTPATSMLNQNTEVEKISFQSVEKVKIKTSKGDVDYNVDSQKKETPDLINKLNSNIKIDLKTKLEAPPTDLKEISATNITPKFEANLSYQLGISTDQLKASGLANSIPAQIGTKAWDQAMGQRIIWMVAGGEQSAQISLNPPDLGPLQVVLKINDNQVDASFITSHLDVRDTLESSIPKLRQMMDEAGIQLSGFSVSAQASQSGQNFSQESSPSRITSLETLKDTNIQNIESTVTKSIKKEIGLVDTFA